MIGMGPDGRRLEGVEYTRFALQQALLTEKGTYPMRADLGSELHERVGDPTTESTRTRIMGNVADVMSQLGGDVRLVGVSAQFVDRGFQVGVDVIRTESGRGLSLEGLRVE